jgi:hypothetical protein
MPSRHSATVTRELSNMPLKKQTEAGIKKALQAKSEVSVHACIHQPANI